MKKFVLLFFVSYAMAADSSLSSDVEGAQIFNSTVNGLKKQLHEKFEKAALLSKREADEMEYKGILDEVKEIKSQIGSLEEQWRSASIHQSSLSDEPYALWDIGEATLSQLIMEYGASDHLYIIPQELGGMKISLFSSVPLPRESWSEMIEMILSQNGVGIRKLNSFAKQLYILKLDPSMIEGIVSREQDLQRFTNYSRLFFVFSPPPEQLKSVQMFFEKFSDPKQTIIQSIGSKIALVSTKDALERLMGLYHAVWEKERGKLVRLINLTKVNTQEAEKVLKAVFADQGIRGRAPYYSSGVDELTTLSLPQGLVLVGEADIVERGERILADLEGQLEDPGEKLIYWYSCKHSNPEDIASVLEKVYNSLTNCNLEKRNENLAPPPAPLLPAVPPPNESGLPSPSYPPANAAFNPVLPATAPFIQPGLVDKNQKTAFGNFIVDTKTTSILMVVKREELPKIKALIKKLDVPKRMVQLDVLLVEKRLTDRKQVGINLLQIGSSASGTTQNAISFDNKDVALNKGSLSFMFSRPSGKAPAFDLTYNFLMAQEDIRINANPSVLAINQTPAQISIVEEISINNGAIPVQLNTAGQVTVEKSYTRAQYGITINLTPTIHFSEDTDEHLGFVSLETNLEFDTTQASIDDRPPVSRRHIENQVCVADGETVILGGLRKKIEEDHRDKIPFLGDLPGIGKLFGLTKMMDTTTETFIFITPHIIHNPVDDLRRIRQSEYQKRAGDIPEFLHLLDEAKKSQRQNLFDNSLKMLLDMY